GSERVRALAIAPHAQVIYVWASRPMVSHDHGASFERSFLDPERAEPFSGIAESPRSANTAYAVGAGLDHPNVYATHDSGRSWQAIHNNLPNASVNAIAVDARGVRDTLYVGVDGGVYISTDEGTHWDRYGVGLPNGSVKALDINTDLGILVVGLNGRGGWRMGSKTAGPPSETSLRNRD